MDRNSSACVPPGFNGRMESSRPPSTAPMTIHHPLAVNAVQNHNVFRQMPVAASAPVEKIPCVEMLLNSSTERRSLSPQHKLIDSQFSQPVFDKARILSCSDLENALKNRLHDESKPYHKYTQRPLHPAFLGLPPIQACSPPQHVPPDVLRMMAGHNLQPIMMGHQLPGRPMRKGHAPVRPPPGFESPVMTPPPCMMSHTPQYSSPQPWSPARLAPIFHKNESVEEKTTGLEPKVNANSRNSASRSRNESMSSSELKDIWSVGIIEREQIKSGAMKYGESLSKPGPSSMFDSNVDLIERNQLGSTPIRLNKDKTPEAVNSTGKKKEKKTKQKKEKKKSKTNANDRQTENAHVLPLPEAEKNNKKVFYVTDLEKTDNCRSGNGMIQPYSPQNVNNSLMVIDKEKEMVKKLKKKFKKQKKVEKFDPYLSIEKVTEGLAQKTLIESEIRINQRNCKEAYISDPEDGRDIIIMGMKDRNRALDGDIVVVQLNDEADWHKQKKGDVQKSGKVVFIKERVHHRCTVGTLHMLDKGLIMLVPRDQRFPLLRIRSQSIPLNLLENISSTNIENILFAGTIISWSITRYAYGIINKKVGQKGELECETAAIFEELGLDREPIPDSSEFLPELPYQIPEEEIKSRLDLRSEVIFTIDPATARDLDDAVSIKKLNDDKFQVGIHISDVTYFLEEGTALDKIVSQRATTVYMVEEAYHMLPITLCNLCSLNPGEDKLAITVLLTVSKNGCILDKEFKRSIIHSCAQLSYDQVQDVIEEKNVEIPELFNNVEFSEIKESVLQLNELALMFRKKRFDEGALKIDQPKLWFKLDESSMPKGFSVYEIKDSNRLIEEFMLLANESVARFIHERAPDMALLRRHDPPKREMMDKLEKSLKEIGISLDSSNAGNLHTSLSKYSNDEMKAHILYHFCARPMKRAVYFCSSNDTHHYALNMEKYTHFTSPIRRYADIVVHRILTACLDLSPMPPWDKVCVNRFASMCNKKKYSAKRASEMSCDLFRMLLLKKVGPLTVDAVVATVSANSINVIIPSLAYNARISLEKLENISYEFIDKDMNSEMKIKWGDIEEIQDLKMFSCVQVLLTCVTNKTFTPQIQAILLPPQNVSRLGR